MPQREYRFRSAAWSSYMPWGVKWLLIINIAVFIPYFLAEGTSLGRHLTAILSLSAQGVLRTFMVWQVVTYLFLHSTILHILFNMLTLWWFGAPLERDWGTRQFLKFYFLCGIVAGLSVLVVNVAFGEWNVYTLGASGAVLGLLVAFGVLYPNQQVLLVIFPMKAKYMVMIVAAIEILIAMQASGTGVSSVAHLGGMAFGYVYIRSRWQRARWSLPDFRGAYRQWRLARAKRKFQVYMRKHGGGPWVN